MTQEEEEEEEEKERNIALLNAVCVSPK